MSKRKYDMRASFGKRGRTVEVKNNNVDKALRDLKKLCERESVTKDLRRHEAHETKGQRRRRKLQAAIFRQRKMDRENQNS